jgi:aspartate racemase
VNSHLGIVGVSPEGAALFFQQLTRWSARLRSPDDQPRFSLHAEPLSLYLDCIRRNDWHGVDRLLRRSAELLHRCGAQLCICPDNVVQHAIQMAEVGSPIPWLTMTDLVAEAVARDGRKRVGIIGTKLVANSSTYQTHLGLRGIRVTTPTPDDAETLEQIIFGELLYGQIRPESRIEVLRIISTLADHQCEGVILACSEAPLLVTRDNSPLPVYDAADILAEAAVRRSLPPQIPAGAAQVHTTLDALTQPPPTGSAQSGR